MDLSGPNIQTHNCSLKPHKTGVVEVLGVNWISDNVLAYVSNVGIEFVQVTLLKP